MNPLLRSFFGSLTIFFCLMAYQEQVAAECCGKIDLGPAYVHVDVLESNKTVKRLDMAAVRSDATLSILKGQGWVVKPFFIYAQGRGELLSTGVGFGHCTPICDWLTVTPSAGCAYTYFTTHVHLPLFGLRHQREKFQSASPYVALEATATLMKGLRLCGSFQYAWSRTYTRIEKFFRDTNSAEGPSYSAMLEYDLSDEWSLQLGGAYNISLSHEKHGLRAYGGKIGIARWF